MAMQVLPAFEGNPMEGMLRLTWEAEPAERIVARLAERGGRVLAEASGPGEGRRGEVEVKLGDACGPWTPRHPRVYRLEVERWIGQAVTESVQMNWGIRDLRVEDGRLLLNFFPLGWRGASVRGDVARSIEEWNRLIFELKQHGCSALRITGAWPGDELLDLCDKAGILVWLDAPASRQQCAAHPSIVIVPDDAAPCPGALAASAADIPDVATAQQAQRARIASSMGFSMAVEKFDPTLFESMRPAWSDLSLVLASEDRNFEPRQAIRIPLWLCNETDQVELVQASVHVAQEDGFGQLGGSVPITCAVEEHSAMEMAATLHAPDQPGKFTFVARLAREGPEIASIRPFRTWKIQPPGLRGVRVAVAEDEEEIRALLKRFNIPAVELEVSSADAVILGARTWQRLSGDAEFRATIDRAIEAGTSILALDLSSKHPGELTLGNLHLAFTPAAATSAPLAPSDDDAIAQSIWGALPPDAGDRLNGSDGRTTPDEQLNVAGEALLLAGDRPIVVEASTGAGRVILSQLITAGRLAEGFGAFDPIAAQLTLNLLRRAVTGR